MVTRMHDPEHKARLLARLRRIEGQVAAVARMVDEDRACVDVLTQIAAVRAALGRTGQLLLGEHIRTCVSDALRSEDRSERDRTVDELVDVFARYGAGGAAR